MNWEEPYVVLHSKNQPPSTPHTHNMTNAQSKLSPIFCTCKQFCHPWTDKCINATAGILIQSMQHSVRIYIVVYALSMIMRHRIPTLADLRKTLISIIQSSAFLGTNSYTYIMYTCLLRNILGRFYLVSIAFLPAFLASLTAIFIERPVRRPLLALYVANVATETVWKMAESRGLVRSIAYGQAAIFGVSVSTLLYLYRLGLHKGACRDSLFSILRIFVGRSEEGPLKQNEPFAGEGDDDNERPQQAFTLSHRESRRNLTTTAGWLGIYSDFIGTIKRKHNSCPHKDACIHYAAVGGIKPFIGGVGLQVILKLLLNLKKIFQFQMNWRKTVFEKSTLRLGVFLGSFSFLYRAVSCALRHMVGRDHPSFAIPAGLVGSIAFTQYSDVTVALYVMWKMLQIVYNLGIANSIVPKVPNFTILLFCLGTATLFHAAILEPKNLRPSYWKFLFSISGGRLSLFDRKPLDAWGLNTSEAIVEVIKRTGTFATHPTYPCAF